MRGITYVEYDKHIAIIKSCVSFLVWPFIHKRGVTYEHWSTKSDTYKKNLAEIKKILIRRTWEKSDTYNLFLAVIKKMIRRTPRTACFYVMCAPTPLDTQRCKEIEMAATPHCFQIFAYLLTIVLFNCANQNSNL